MVLTNNLRNKIISKLIKVLGKDNVIYQKNELYSYSYDASLEVGIPEIVVFPLKTEQVSQIIKLCNQHNLPFLARGNGTGYSGGSIPTKGGMIINLLKMNKILEFDLQNKTIHVESGIINGDINRFLLDKGYRYIPDPASYNVSTIGGNISENAGGPNCLGYGVTSTHLLGMEFVTSNGDIINIGSDTLDYCSINLGNFICGSEGTLGIITKAILKIEPLQQSKYSLLIEFDNIKSCAKTVSNIIAAGTKVCAIEMMVATPIKKFEKKWNKENPSLLINIEYSKDEINFIVEDIKHICHKKKPLKIDIFNTPFSEMRDLLIRKRMKNLLKFINSPRYFLIDAVVPRKKLFKILNLIKKVAEKYNLSYRNNFHAGDGNIHPSFFYNPNNNSDKIKLKKAIDEVTKICILNNGTLSGEHGIGLEKKKYISLIFKQHEIKLHKRIKTVFNNKNMCNPNKVF